MDRSIFSIITMGVISLFGVIVLFGSFYTVDEGERVVLLRNGAVIGTEGPGWHLKTPVIEDAVSMSIRTEKSPYKLSAYSKDIQSAEVVITVQHRLNPAKVSDVYAQYGEDYVDRIVAPIVNARSKVVFGGFTAAESISERGRLALEVEAAITAELGGADADVLIDGVQIEDISFSEEFNHAVEQRMQAEIEVAKRTQNLAMEKVQADIVRATANGAADARRAEAEAEAFAILTKAKAEAEGINVRGTALAKNPGLVALVKAERWDGMLPKTMLPNSTVPFMDMGVAE